MFTRPLSDLRLASSPLLLWALVACAGAKEEDPPVEPPRDSRVEGDSKADDSAVDDSATDDSGDSTADDSEDSKVDDSAADDSAADDSAADDSDAGPVDADNDGFFGDLDCDDSNADAHPGAYERCDDGVENDCDGAMDCADSSCASASVCLEDCADGLDNDLDALIDCEDGDCATASACVEDCTDGVDGDGDSFVDCLDDDCWASCGVKVTNKLHGGALTYTHTLWNYSDITWGSSFTGTTIVGEARSLSGSIELSGPDGVIQCPWSVPRAEFLLERQTERSLYNETSSTSNAYWPIITSTAYHVADSVILGAGCPLPGDAVLPARIIGASMPSSVGGLEQLYSSGGPWYSGEATVLFSGHYYYKTTTHRYRMEIPVLNPTTAHWSP